MAQKQAREVSVGLGWAGNSVNTVIFRKNSITSFKGIQFIAYYDQEGFVIVGKRKTGDSLWEIRKTNMKGNIHDAHNTISIMVDGKGYVHLAWDHHNNPLHYCRSKEPYSLEFTDQMPMTGSDELKVAYPEFYRLPNGNLLFFYRSGASGKGNMVIDRYDVTSQKWTQLHKNLIDGEEQRSAYWQACVDAQGVIHLSWVWRETPDVASNHDLCYACSKDEGLTWEKSNGQKYTLPINASGAEYACHIPQSSELINQTSMAADEKGRPFIATYWKDPGTEVPQYHVVYKNEKGWQVQSLSFRTTPFSLSGVGTKRIPVSRPQMLLQKNKQGTSALILFRDAERGDKASVAINENINKNTWVVKDLTLRSLGSWEPSYDTELWKTENKLNLFIEKVDQVDAEGTANVPPQAISVLEWKMNKYEHIINQHKTH